MTLSLSDMNTAYAYLLTLKTGYTNKYVDYYTLLRGTGCRPEEALDITRWSKTGLDTYNLQPFKGNLLRVLAADQMPNDFRLAIAGQYNYFYPFTYYQLRFYFNRFFPYPQVAHGKRQIAGVIARYMLVKQMKTDGSTDAEIKAAFGWNNVSMVSTYANAVITSEPVLS